jgi:hypothetical protein
MNKYHINIILVTTYTKKHRQLGTGHLVSPELNFNACNRFVKNSRIGIQCRRNTKPHSSDIAVCCRFYSSNAPSLGMRRLARRVLHIRWLGHIHLRWLRIQQRWRLRRLVGSTANKHQKTETSSNPYFLFLCLETFGH